MIEAWNWQRKTYEILSNERTNRGKADRRKLGEFGVESHEVILYRSWLDDTGAPLTVQKELMRHASIQTTMNIYGKAMTDSKRQAHHKAVEMVLNSSNAGENPAISANWEQTGVLGYAQEFA